MRVHSSLKNLVVANTGLPLPSLSLCNPPPISYLPCSCLYHCHDCLIIQALCHKAAENPISHLLMASAFSLSYSTIMYQAQRAPTPSLWTCSGWEMSFSPQHSDFSQGKNIASLWRSEHCRFFTWAFSLRLWCFTSLQLNLLFFSVVTVFFFVVYSLHVSHSLALYVSAPHIMLNSLFPVLMLSFKCHQEFTCFVYGWSAPCRDYLHYKSNFHIFELVNYVQLHITSVVPGASLVNAIQVFL